MTVNTSEIRNLADFLDRLVELETEHDIEVDVDADGNLIAVFMSRHDFSLRVERNVRSRVLDIETNEGPDADE